MKKVEAQEINCKDCIDFRTLVYIYLGLRVEGMPELTNEEINMTCAKLTKQSMF